MINVIFISGSSRSGSTFLDYQLGARPTSFSLGELRQLVKRAIHLNEKCGCGEYFSDCNTWQRIMAEFQKSHSLKQLEVLDAQMRSAKHYLFPFLFNKERKEYRQLMHGLIQKIVEVTGCNYIIDSSKTGYYASLVYGNSRLYSVNYLWLYRNPLGVLHSMSKTRERFEHNPSNESSLKTMRKTGLIASSLLWGARCFESIAHGFRFKKKHFINYNDLGSEAVTDFFNELLGKELIPDKEHHAISGNPSRFKSNFLEFKPDMAYTGRGMGWKFTASIFTIPVRVLYKGLSLSAFNVQGQKQRRLEKANFSTSQD